MEEGAEHAFIQKYANRVLMLTTEHCFSNCQYCFRTSLLDEESKITLPSLEQKSQIVADAVRNNPAIEEVILSGGDPLTIGAGGLERIFSTIKAARDDIKFRVHTRAIAYAPHVFKPELVDTLSEYDVRTFFHINHPYEITDQQHEVFQRMHEAGLRMYNQSPILRGINDHERVLGRLVTQLEDEHVRHINFFIADPICYSADFRVPLARLYEISDILQWSLPSWSANFRLVLDTPFGKVRREDIVSWDKQSEIVVFRREGHDVIYHDLPQSMYVPGDLSKMLRKDGYAKKS
jgi:lysine 2,3-aminomutase